jgi:hypothetical protein
MYLPTIVEINLIGVADAGVPNHERVMLRPNETVTLSQFGVAIGVRTEEPSVASLLRDQTIWLPEITVSPPAWILIYTGPGTDRQDIFKDQPVFVLHWNKEKTVFGNPAVIPVLVRVDAVVVGPGPI